MEIRREESIRSRSCAELLRAARLGIGWRASPAKDNTYPSREKDVLNLPKWDILTLEKLGTF